MCIRQPGGQACKTCRLVRGRCSHVFPSCTRRHNLTEEDELRWRVQGIQPPCTSVIQVHFQSQARCKQASFKHSNCISKLKTGARQSMKGEEDDEQDDDSVDDRRRLLTRPVSWTHHGRVVRFGKNPPSQSSLSNLSDQGDKTCAAVIEGRMSQMEITMKESAKAQKYLANSMKEMSSTLVKMSTEMVRSLSQRSSSDPGTAQQLHQLSARSHAITQALDNQGQE